MLNAGDTALPWEPYTGGKPSPSPDYPQEIVSAEGKVIVSGKNLLNIENSSNSDGGLKTVIDDGVITINGVTTSASYIWNFCTFTCEVDGTYVLSTNDNIGSKDVRLIFDVNNGSLITAYPYAKIELKHDDMVRIFLRIDKENYSLNNAEVRPQLEYGSEATDYEPYHAKQTITLTAPTSLPGIPASSGGNYTDENGQQWICDEVDLGRGVYVQRVKYVQMDASNLTHDDVNDATSTHWYLQFYVTDSSLDGAVLRAAGFVMCSKMRVVSQKNETAYDYPIVAPYGHRDYMELRFRAPKTMYSTWIDFVEDISGCVVYYPLLTPIETPISPAEIAAYRALTTYGPTTIVETDGAGIKLDYQRDVNIVIKQLTDAIASMTN